MICLDNVAVIHDYKRSKPIKIQKEDVDLSKYGEKFMIEKHLDGWHVYVLDGE